MTQNHWVFNGQVGEPLRAPDIRKLLADLVRIIDMTAIAEPIVYVDGSAWRGLQLIAESHISLHGEGRDCAVDVFSCRSFEPQHVLACLAQWMPGRWVGEWIERGQSAARRAGGVSNPYSGEIAHFPWADPALHTVLPAADRRAAERHEAARGGDLQAVYERLRGVIPGGARSQ